VRFRLLGPFEIMAGEPVSIPRRRERCLLAVLLLELGRPVADDRLIDLLWDGAPPPSAASALRSHISRLRAIVDSDDLRIGRQGQGYVAHADPEHIDAHQFQALVRQARTAPMPARAPMLREALALWRGPVLADIGSDLIRDRMGAGLEELRLEALDLRIDADLASGQHRALIPELRELVAAHPNRERFAGQLMVALYRSERQTDALRVYKEYQRVLADELGLYPGPELRRLHEQILRGDPELNLVGADRGALPATGATHQAPRQLPHDIANFTGRGAELARLDTLAGAGGSAGGAAPTIVSIDGAPGTGKTTLAVHWAHRIAHRYPDAQLHLNLRGYGTGDPITPAAAAETLLRGLGVDGELIPSGAEERAALLRSRLAAYDVLILLDNARDSDQVRPLLPATGSLVIVTSRNQLRGLSIRDGAHRVTLSRLPADQAVELLAGAVGPDRVAAEPAAAARLVELCDHLPLALAIVAERTQRAGTLAEVVNALSDEQARLDNLGTGEDDPHTDLRAALSWSYRALGADAAATFRKLGLHPADDIGVDAAAALANMPVVRAKAVLDQLVAAHLVEQRRPHRYELHDLIRLYAADLAHIHASSAERDAAMHRVLDWYLHAAVNADRRLYPQRRRDFVAPYEPSTEPPEFADAAAATRWLALEYDCLRAVVDWATTHGCAGHAWRIAVAMTTFFNRTIPWSDGLMFYESVLRAVESAGDLTGMAYTLNSLGTQHFNRGDPGASLAVFERSLAQFQRLSHRRGEAMLLGNLGLVCGELGEHDQARRYAMLARTLCEELDYPRGTAMNLDNLGVTHTVAGEYDAAIDRLLQADAIYRELGDIEAHAGNQHHLGNAYAGLGESARSTRAFRESIGMWRAVGSRRWEAVVLTDFGRMLQDAGHSGLARRMWEAALVTMRELGDPRAPGIQAALDGLEPARR
jgi:DNA-binding SARP family transcriptional activator